MKAKLIYIVTFSAVFLIVTFGIIMLNNNYKNIFAFDFTPVGTNELPEELRNTTAELEINYLKHYFKNDFQKQLLDSIKSNTLVRTDTIYKEILKDESLLDSINIIKRELETVRAALAEKLAEKAEETPVAEIKETVNADWVKETAKLFEAMDPKQAAKVISKYSDNEARDVIFNMKQKNAAEILSLLKPDFVNRITKPE